jgi:hypothetical protein
MIVLIPVLRYRVAYELASGRPYSRFEQLVLQAIAGGATSVEQLQQVFHVHSRLIVEAVVTLAQAGWVAVAGGGGREFVVTSVGATAVGSGVTPSAVLSIPRVAHLMVERVTAGIVLSTEARSQHKSKLKSAWRSSIRMRIEVANTRLDESRVAAFVPRFQGQWVRAVHRVDLIRAGGDWLPVTVDAETGRIVGLPSSWEHRLTTRILMEVTGRAVSEANPGDWRPTAAFGRARDPERIDEAEGTYRSNISVTRDDLLVGANEHEAAFLAAAAEARTTLLVASSMMTGEGIERWTPALAEMARRGVKIYILWSSGRLGRGGDRNFQSALKATVKVANSEVSADSPGGIRWNREPARVGTSLLLWDSDGVMTGVLGPFPWLGAPTGKAMPVSVRIRSLGVLAGLAEFAASAWASVQTEHSSSAPGRWHEIASDPNCHVAVFRKSLRRVRHREWDACL